MKKGIVWAILSSVLLFSCSDDDDDGGSGSFPAELVGSWSSSAFSRTDCTDTGDNATCDTSGCMTLTFASNGSYSGGFPDVVLQGTATGNTSSLKLCTPANECTDVSYTLISGTLAATWQDSEDGCTYAVTMTKQ
eukprot:CAMPEP_0114604562 /NCGR_PEP_ID=MMETSP0168-20121206/610_1 /TAXON_ID=95228 ORGANISM="Vannella sp., Strain DIVA3 517/6/12" /NCGR_SAMPLE_ID=MMETSP0168 /ASSEMBLY_ACC=CAM_ASM_000044 /LENGTH=134 /DNA_ID=CAMNT_0001815399 /DNA_START=65 /DNA_END=469 /DNA_ORIENTATION=-